MTDETSREREDEQPETEGHMRAPEERQEQEEPEVEGHASRFGPGMAAGPERAMGPEKAGGPERAAF
jgi:hypothetical protein